jgi:hypothetical protein
LKSEEWLGIPDAMDDVRTSKAETVQDSGAPG